MPVFYDQIGREISLAAPPKRIVSVVPSQTELLFYLGLDQEIVGITKYCIHPADKFKTSAKIGGTKQLDIAGIKALKPDLIIANKEENDQSQIEELMMFCPVWVSDINDLSGAVDMIEKLGVLVNRESAANALSGLIKGRFDSLTMLQSPLRIAYFIWRKPYLVAGRGTFINNMLQKCGFTNAFEQGRYPEVDAAMIADALPDVVLLSSEPYPFKEKHIAEFKALLPSAVIKVVDGELFSWYGSRLLYAPAYFEGLINLLSPAFNH
ncbi:MAG: ABC transporter substrate-binding protein [Sphingobacteriales bacterium]